MCLFAALLTVSLARHDGRLPAAISSDTKGYYMYLPAIFEYGGVHNITDSAFVGHMANEKGEVYTKFTCGVAFCYLPFFLVAHAYAHFYHLGPSCLTAPYCYAIIVCGVFWAVLGFFLLRTLLLRYFSRAVTWLAIFSIALGTNLYCYATLDMGMSHVYSFALFAAVLLLIDSYYKVPSAPKAIGLALLLGWIVLIRPTNTAFLLFLFLYRVVNYRDLKMRFSFFGRYLSHLLIGAPFFIAVMFPQLLYWKTMTGHWIHYSYGNEHFLYWCEPKILAVLFDVQNGWLLYSPVMLFLFWSLFAKRKDARTSFWGTLLVLAVITYVFASWDAWWFGGAFGHRCYIDYYPVMAFPMAMTMKSIVVLKNKVAKIALLTLLLLLCYYSVGMASIYLTHGIWDGAYWRWNYDKWWDLVRMVFFLPV